MNNLALFFTGLALAISTVVNVPEKDTNKGFDFNKYKEAMMEMAEVRFAKSIEPIRFEAYALIDIDGDGLSEVWVRGDEGQDWQGVFSIEGDSVVLLADADATSELMFYPNAVGYSGYISPGRVDEAFSVLKNSRIVASCEKHVEFNIFSEEMEITYESYHVNDKATDEDGYNAFVIQLGDTVPIAPVWHSVK